MSGLRLSQFNEDKVGGPSDTKQKTLTDFLIMRDASRKNVGANGSLGSTLDDQHLTNDTEAGFPVDNYDIYSYDGRDLLDGKQFPDLEDNSHAISNNAGDMENIHGASNNETANEVCEYFKDWFIILVLFK